MPCCCLEIHLGNRCKSQLPGGKLAAITGFTSRWRLLMLRVNGSGFRKVVVSVDKEVRQNNLKRRMGYRDGIIRSMYSLPFFIN